MTSDVVLGFESVDIDVGGHERSVRTPSALDLALHRGQPGATTAYSGQLVGTGILSVPGGLGAVLRGNHAVVAALCAILGGNPALGDGLGSVVGSLGTPRRSPGALVCRNLEAARRSIPGGSIEIAGDAVAGFGLLVTQPRGEGTFLGCQPGFPSAHSCRLVAPGMLTVLGGLHAIFRGNLAVIDRLGTVVGSLCAPPGSQGAFVGRLLALVRRTISCDFGAIARRVVARLGLVVTKRSGDIARLSACTVRRRSLSILGCNLAVIGGQGSGWTPTQRDP